MSVVLYLIDNCSTCKSAVRFLEDRSIVYKKVSLKEKAPSKEELFSMLSFQKNEGKKLFNTSGLLYKELRLKDRISTFSLEEMIDLLTKEGMLVKRPFLLTLSFGLVGFKEKEWENAFLSYLSTLASIS